MHTLTTEYSYKLKENPTPTTVPSKEYSYKINNAPATTVQPKSLPPREYGFNFLDGEVIPDPPKPTEKPSQYNYKIYENPPPTTVLPKKIKGTLFLPSSSQACLQANTNSK